MSSNPAAAVASFGKALYPHLPSLSEETLSRRTVGQGEPKTGQNYRMAYFSPNSQDVFKGCL